MPHLRRAANGALALLIAFSMTIGTAVAQATTAIVGTVTTAGKPAANVPVTLSGNDVVLHARSNPEGRFAFNALTIGTYTVSVPGSHGIVRTQVNVTSAGATVALDTETIPQIGHITVASAPVAKASGTDYVINGGQLARIATGNSLPDILLQAPAAARGSDGQIHINGDHNGIDYVIDGVEIPEGLNRVLGDEIDPSDIGFAELIEGAYPAQYGNKFAGIFNIATKSDTGPPGYRLQTEYGSYGTADSVLGYHAPVGNGGSISVGIRNERTDWSLDPPVPNPVHDAGSIGSQFVHLALPVHGTDTITFDLVHSLQTFQIPPDTSSGTPADTDDDEDQEDLFSSLIYRHTFSNGGVLSFGPSFKRSRILDTNDPGNDLIGQISGPDAGPCTDFSNCSFLSVYADRVDVNDRLTADYVQRIGHHRFQAGGIYGAENLAKDDEMTVPATNAAGTALTPFTVTDTAPNVGHTEEFYAEDGWEIDPRWRADYGVRADMFQIFSTDFDTGFAQVSPRLKLTRILSPTANVYAYYGRLFVPFSLESISPAAAAALYGTTASATATNDLKPQRDSLYELGGHIALGRGELGVRISHKVSTDWIDDTQVGATNLHQDINFPRGRVDSQSLEYVEPLARNGRFSLSAAHVVAVNSLNCETQLLQNCAASGPPGGDFVQADHDQHYDVSSELLFNDLHGGWFSINGEYGSGLSLGNTTLCPPYPMGDAINCKVPPHLTFDAEKGLPIGAHAHLALIVRNLFNDKYAITLDNTLQGTHEAEPRTFQVEYRLNSGG